MNMNASKEIGGYIEFERYVGTLYHEDGLKLNCGRACLEYLIRAHGIKAIMLPDFLCSSIEALCRKMDISVRFYNINDDFEPEWGFELGCDEWLYIVDYYGQLSDVCYESASQISHGRLILDESQNYFARPRKGVDTIYTARKYFGVPDGAFLFTESYLSMPLPKSESYKHMNYLLGRFERSASEFYGESVANNKRFAFEPLSCMSALTENLLRGIDYDAVRCRRNKNYQYLSEILGKWNRLELKPVQGPFAYPLLVTDGDMVKRRLAEKKIYIPTLWPNVVTDERCGSVSKKYARNILPLPVDQRYGESEMEIIAKLLIEEELLG